MNEPVPIDTIRTFAKTICAEAGKYGFSQTDTVRLINEMLDIAASNDHAEAANPRTRLPDDSAFSVDTIPLRSDRVSIRKADANADLALLEGWLDDAYGRHFLLSCATAQRTDPSSLLENSRNEVGIIHETDGAPIGAVAFLDIDKQQQRAELRKLIGVADARGKGYAEEATRLWIQYGGQILGLQKIYVSTLQTHLRNIQLNEAIGFRVEGLLRREICIDDTRYDVLRMGLCLSA